MEEYNVKILDKHFALVWTNKTELFKQSISRPLYTNEKSAQYTVENLKPYEKKLRFQLRQVLLSAKVDYSILQISYLNERPLQDLSKGLVDIIDPKRLNWRPNK